MARKRRRGSPHYISSDSEGDSDFDNLAHCNDEYDVSPKAHAINLSGSEDFTSSDDVSVKRALYLDCCREYKKIKDLKSELKKSLSHKLKNAGPAKTSNDAFTRFSVRNFSKVIAALSPDQRLIFLTKQSVQYVLGLPFGGRPFPINTSTGKSVEMELFQKQSIPSVSFSNKITEHEAMSDEQLFVCFILIALNYFFFALILPWYQATNILVFLRIFSMQKSLTGVFMSWNGY